MKIFKIATIIVTAFAITMSFSACAPSNSTVVAKPTGDRAEDKSLQITFKQFKQAYDKYLIDNEIDVTNSSFESSEDTYKKAALDQLVDDTMLKKVVSEEGLDELTEEQNKEMAEYVQSQLDSYKESFKTEAQENDSLLEGEELEAKGEELYQKKLKALNYTEEDLMEDIKYNYKLTLLSNKIIDALNLTIEDAVEYSKTMYEEQFEIFQDSTYGPYFQQVYLPENSRMIKHILIGFSDEVKEKIQTYRSNGDDEGADKYRDEQLAAIKEKADEALTKVKAMENSDEFNELMTEYSDDPGKESNPDGYLIFEGMTNFITEFYDAGMSLKNIGDYTDLVGSDYGYHIIQYASKAEVSEEDLKELNVEDTYFYYIKVQEAINEANTKWVSDFNFEIYYDVAGINVDDSSSST